MNRVVKILMERDDYSRTEAIELFNDTRNEICDVLENGGDYSEVEDIMLDNLGLEMDYIIDMVI